MNKKNKFIENKNNELNKQPYFDQTTNDCIKDIIKDNYSSKNKSSIELTDNLNPFINYFWTFLKQIGFWDVWGQIHK